MGHETLNLAPRPFCLHGASQSWPAARDFRGSQRVTGSAGQGLWVFTGASRAHGGSRGARRVTGSGGQDLRVTEASRRPPVPTESRRGRGGARVGGQGRRVTGTSRDPS